MKYREEQRQRLMNATATASPANNKLQKKRLECLEFYCVRLRISIIMGTLKFECEAFYGSPVFG